MWQQEHKPSSSSSPSQHLMPLLLILIICLFLQEPFLIVAGVCGFLLGFCAMLNHSHSFLSLPQNGPGSAILPLFCNLPPHTAGVRVLLFVLGFLFPLCCVPLHCGKDVQSWWGRPLLSELVGYRAAFIYFTFSYCTHELYIPPYIYHPISAQGQLLTTWGQFCSLGLENAK